MSSLPDLYNLMHNIDLQLAEAMQNAVSGSQRTVQELEKVTKYILLTAGSLHLAVAIDDLAEVGALPAITFLPNLPSWIQGIVNIRSEIVSVIDFSGFLNIPEKDRNLGNRLAVLRYKKQKIGIILDRIIGRISRTQTETKPLDFLGSNSFDTSLFSAGLLVDSRFYYILNVREFLTAPRLIDYNRVG